MLLEVRGLDVRYGRIQAVKGIDISVARGEIVTVLGANSAGKSTLLRTLIGLTRPARGSIRFNGIDLTGWRPAKRVEHGLALVPEGRQILVSLTTHENLLMGAYQRKDWAAIEEDLERVYGRFSNLRERRDLPASVLSGGEQQMLAIGRALLARPRLMMLDEPSLGLSPILVDQLFELIRELNEEGLSILLVEQNIHKALQTAHRGYVLELGKLVMEGTPESLLSDEKLQEAYLGGETGMEDPGSPPAQVPAGAER